MFLTSWDVVEQIMLHVEETEDVVRLGAMCRASWRRCVKNHWIEAAAQREVDQEVPYCTVPGSALELIKLLRLGQTTSYYLMRLSSYPHEIILSLTFANAPSHSSSLLTYTLQGTVLKPGQYWLFTSRENAFVFTREEELREQLDRLMLIPSRATIHEEFLIRFKRDHGWTKPGEYADEVDTGLSLTFVTVHRSQPCPPMGSHGLKFTR